MSRGASGGVVRTGGGFDGSRDWSSSSQRWAESWEAWRRDLIHSWDWASLSAESVKSRELVNIANAIVRPSFGSADYVVFWI